MAERPIANAWVARNFERRIPYGSDAASHSGCVVPAVVSSPELPTPNAMTSDGRRLFSVCASEESLVPTSIFARPSLAPGKLGA